MRDPLFVMLIGAVLLVAQLAWVAGYGVDDHRIHRDILLFAFSASAFIGGAAWAGWVYASLRMGIVERIGVRHVVDPVLTSPEERRRIEREMWDRRRAREQHERLRALAAGARVKVGEVDYDDPLAAHLKPAALLLSLTRFALDFPDYDELTHEDYLARTGGNPSKAELEELERQRAGIEAARAASLNYRLAVRRLAQAGFAARIGGQGDYCGQFVVLRTSGRRADLARLEALAADDAGLLGKAQRAEAARVFAIFMARNYSRDYLANRAKLPDVGGSPYHAKGAWRET